MTPDDALQMILKFRDDRDWAQFHDPKNTAISLSLEVAEVLELFQWTKDNNLQEGREEDLRDELADVYAYLLVLAHDSGIDLNEALAQKMKKNAKKYPLEKAKGNNVKYTDL